nr:ribosomal protein S3 [Trentepohlia sp. YN1242]
MGQKVSPIGLRLGITHKHQSQWFVDPRNGSMKKNYPSLILEDRFIRQFITPKFPRASIAQILIFRTLDYIRVEVYTAPTQNLSLVSNKRAKTFNKSTNDSLQQDNTSNQENKSENSTVNDVYDNSLNGFNLKALQEDLQLELTVYKKKTLSLLFSNPKEKDQIHPENTSIQSNVNLGILIKQLNKPFQYASVFAKYLATQLEKRENSVKQALNSSLKLIQNYKINGIKIIVSGRLNGTDIAEHKSIFKGRIPLSSIHANIDYCVRVGRLS